MAEYATLIKFGNLEHIQELQEEGLLYMNNLPYFWKVEDNELRGDLNDGVSEIQRGVKGSLKNEYGSVIPITMTKWELRILPENADKINIFCMYALRPARGTYPINVENNKFGNHTLLITNPNEFINRIQNKVKKELIKTNCKYPEASFVEYVANDYKGNIGLFKKLMKFSYQSEWRFVCYDGIGGARKTSIGSLKDISIIIPSEEVNQRITIDKNGLINF